MKILHLDIETAPNIVYTWGLFNQNVGLDQIVESGHTLCWAAAWHTRPNTVMYKSIYHTDENDMINTIHALLEEADIVVHYNGRKFDMPILNKEFVKLGLEPPTPYQQVDLLETARRRFRFVSNKLDYVAQFLGLGSKLPHKGMKLWNECLAGDAKAWATMKKYNIQDVKLLPKLYNKLLPWINNHPNVTLFTDSEEVACTNCGSHNIKKNGVEHLQTQSYQRYKCNECGTNLKGRTTILPIAKRKATLTQSKL
jgi:DNA polymerase elongation subunit (family B)